MYHALIEQKEHRTRHFQVNFEIILETVESKSIVFPE